MGYYTKYKLEINDSNKIDIIKELIEYYHEASYAINEDGSLYDETKWYDHESDLKDFSKNYSNILFELSGEGEESGDMWKKYFKNGKMQESYARIEFDEFDENKLK